MEVHEPAIKTISHEKMSIMIVLMAVASIESVFFTPTFARIAVIPANKAEPKARIIHTIITFFPAVYYYMMVLAPESYYSLFIPKGKHKINQYTNKIERCIMRV